MIRLMPIICLMCVMPMQRKGTCDIFQDNCIHTANQVYQTPRQKKTMHCIFAKNSNLKYREGNRQISNTKVVALAGMP